MVWINLLIILKIPGKAQTASTLAIAPSIRDKG